LEIGTQKKGRVKYMFSSNGIGYQVAKYVSNKNDIEGTITSASFFLVEKTKESQKIRPLLISKDSFDYRPKQVIIPKSKIIEVGKKKGWIEIDISELNLTFPKEGLFIGLEFLTENDEVEVNNRLNIGLQPFEKEEYTWVKYLGSDWNIPPFLRDSKNRRLNLMIKVKIESPIGK
ncbi:MAG: hypothetical protein AAF960_29040, partial [Bacteroidota bacterium]